MADLDLCYLPAHEALARFRAKTLSPVELMQAVIARAEAVKDPINAFTFTHFDEAMDRARKAEAKYAKGQRTRALEGLPIGIKDENEIAGKPPPCRSFTCRCNSAASRLSLSRRKLTPPSLTMPDSGHSIRMRPRSFQVRPPSALR